LISAHAWGVVWDTDHSKWNPQAGYDNYPVINVTWYGAKAYADWLGGSLPTEAQWEYACRAGTSTSYSFGAGNIRDYAWYDDNSGDHTHPVGEKSPNAWGLYDMHGNVYEWCNDWYANYGSTPASDPVTNPTGPSTGANRVLRGGSWYSSAQYCRSAFRSDGDPDYADYDIGFRVVLVP
jgi:formylglycine-generating enzyme required for sulfatase activity